MRKSIFALAPAALLLMTVAGTTQAATNGNLSVTANISEATCDVNLTRSAIDLGNFSQADFPAAKGSVASDTVGVTLANCALATGATDAGAAKMIISGSTLSVDNEMFNSQPSADVGVLVRDAGTTVNIKKDEAVLLKQFSTTDKADGTKLNALSKTFEVHLASQTAGPKTSGKILAPIVFQFDYN